MDAREKREVNVKDRTMIDGNLALEATGRSSILRMFGAWKM